MGKKGRKRENHTMRLKNNYFDNYYLKKKGRKREKV